MTMKAAFKAARASMRAMREAFGTAIAAEAKLQQAKALGLPDIVQARNDVETLVGWADTAVMIHEPGLLRDIMRRWRLSIYAKRKDGGALFYVQDARQYVGNSMMWWAEGSNGYTSDPSKAQVWTKADLRTLPGRHTDIAWPKAYIDARWRHHVDAQTCNKAEAGAIEPPRPKPPKKPRHSARCGECGRFTRNHPSGFCDRCDGGGWWDE